MGRRPAGWLLLLGTPVLTAAVTVSLAVAAAMNVSPLNGLYRDELLSLNAFDRGDQVPDRVELGLLVVRCVLGSPLGDGHVQSLLLQAHLRSSPFAGTRRHPGAPESLWTIG